ncbi:hypothetical protein PV08_09599 [Exophiala spinifera]|uniref:Glutamine amidotransferase domain-containing protein n=1 Tax=Exophiala spinifera TaxID=91928 RepID=A0A0D1ZHB0_9EURO|nr:uncharacterized protein PV08_09599 [Exophiala spinifera]KIW12322.1 hypothetical protein PV08_09599 [Exophiala spinifera]
MLNRISESVLISAPDADIRHYEAIEGADLPKTSDFNLVILTGGTWDLSKAVLDPWVAKVVDWVKDCVNFPDIRVIGLVGVTKSYREHLAAPSLFERAEHWSIAVENIPVTPRGREFFEGQQALRLHKFHKRVVSVIPEGSQQLGVRAEILILDSNQILTFQGHLEMTAAISQSFVEQGDTSYLTDLGPEGHARLRKSLEAAHNGDRTFARALSWAFEPLNK